MDYHIADLNLSSIGERRIEWAEKEMGVLRLVKERFQKEKPLSGLRISACLHVTTETANLALTLKSGGAEVYLCASNPLSTQDDVTAALVKNGVAVFAIREEDRDTYYNHINETLDRKPHITMDDGADLTSVIHRERKDLADNMLGGSEETTTGVIRLRSLEKKGLLLFPLISVNDANTKHLFDNRYGTGQSAMDGIIRATNRLVAGSTFVVCGYGWCGKGVAKRAQGLGANVIVTEVSALNALEAVMDGFRVMPIAEAAKLGDFFCTVTGDTNVISKEHFELMKSGAILANAGHFDVEIDARGLKEKSIGFKKIREFVDEYTLPSTKKIYLLSEGRLVNLAAAEGHPSAVMDMSFANQALCAEFLAKSGEKLEKKVYPVPSDIDEKVAQLKLNAMNVSYDSLTEEQEKYLSSWEIGT
ncbi:MAG: adenosylhomocysteinase [Campylobacterota bacterium]|nr:adenosylhomocysteinase [Campylobacterota bacterium]